MFMEPAKHPENEDLRISALRDLNILDTEPEASFDQLTYLVQQTFGCDTALISLVDTDRQWFKSRQGLCTEQTDRSISFCSHVVYEEQALIVEDAAKNPRFRDNPLVNGEDESFRFYAGIPLYSKDRLVMGTLCILDHNPTSISQSQLEILQRFAQLAEYILHTRRQMIDLDQERQLFADGPIIITKWMNKPGWPLAFVSGNSQTIFNCTSSELLGSGFYYENFVHPADKHILRDILDKHHKTDALNLTCDYRILRENGSEIWVHQVSHSELDANHNLLAVHGYLIEQTQKKQLELRLKSHKERNSLIMDAASLGSMDWHIPSGQTQYNLRFARMCGLRIEELEPHICAWQERIEQTERQRVLDQVDEHICGNRPVIDVEYPLQTESNQTLWIHTYGRVVEHNDTGPIRLVATHRDITERRRDEQAREQQAKLLRLINQAQQTFIQKSDIYSVCDFLFPQLIDMTGSQFGFIGETAEDQGHLYMKVISITDISWDTQSRELYLKHHDKGLEFHNLDNLFGRAILDQTIINTSQASDHPFSKGIPKGHPRLNTFLGIPIMYQQKVYGLLGLANRLNAYEPELVEFLSPLINTLGMLFHNRQAELYRKSMEQELRTLATTDGLTGLMNRRAFLQKLEDTLLMPESSSIALVMLDIDHFKKINDTYGHQTGDQVLTTLSRTLEQTLPATCSVGRLGGEEFAILFQPAIALDTALNSLRESHQAIQALRFTVAPLEQKKTEQLSFTTSFGLVYLEESDSHNAEFLLAQADDRLYQAKNKGRNRIEWLTL